MTRPNQYPYMIGAVRQWTGATQALTGHGHSRAVPTLPYSHDAGRGRPGIGPAVCLLIISAATAAHASFCPSLPAPRQQLAPLLLHCMHVLLRASGCLDSAVLQLSIIILPWKPPVMAAG